jgi:hypothetical protein
MANIAQSPIAFSAITVTRSRTQSLSLLVLFGSIQFVVSAQLFKKSVTVDSDVVQFDGSANVTETIEIIIKKRKER